MTTMIFKRLSFLILITFFIPGVFATENLRPEVIFETSMGSFTLELYPDKAPLTVANFLKYVDEGFYDNTLFHRVIPDFVIQGGGFEKGMKPKPKTHAPIKNESGNRLKNISGTVTMARRTHPDTATSQFFINLSHNARLDYKSDYQPGYTVFGNVSQGMNVIEKIAGVTTATVDRFKDVPEKDVIVLSVKRKIAKLAQDDKLKTDTPEQEKEKFVAGEHYIVLESPVPTRDSGKIEVVEMFSFGCPHCYEFEPLVKDWGKQQAGDVDFWYFPAVWNNPMKLFARAFYAARKLNVEEKIHFSLFTALVVEQKNIRNESDLGDFFAKYGVDKKSFADAFNSTTVVNQARQAESRVGSYKPAGVPEIVINGKYRIDRMRAGGLSEMLAVAEFLINKERALLDK